MSETEKTFITRTQAAERAGVAVTTIDRWVRHGQLTRYKVIGGAETTRFDQEQLDRLLTPQPENAS